MLAQSLTGLSSFYNLSSRDHSSCKKAAEQSGGADGWTWSGVRKAVAFLLLEPYFVKTPRLEGLANDCFPECTEVVHLVPDVVVRQPQRLQLVLLLRLRPSRTTMGM